MSDIPDQPPLVSAIKARNVARLYKGLAELFADAGDPARAAQAERDSARWMAYADRAEGK